MFNKKKKINHEIEPDEIFLDSSNIPDFNVDQFEGRIEKPISQKTIFILGMSFIIISFIFIFKIGNLQITKGDYYKNISENNRLNHTPIFPERGIIYDRNKKELAWNVSNNIAPFSTREYIANSGMGHLLGYVNYPAKDKFGFYWNDEYKGKEGVEKKYNNLLQGVNGLKIIETNALMEVQSESIIQPPQNGQEVILSIDSRLQTKLFDFMSSLSKEVHFQGGSGILMDVQTGEILAMASFPEYSSAVLSSGKNVAQIQKYLKDKRKPFLNRAIAGLYTPGSIVKPFIALGALTENIINPTKKILSTGSISIANPYFPKKKSVFMDWKAHGWVDMRRALAVSSNVYFYEIGGGFENQKGLGVVNIEKYTRMFGLGEKTDIDLLGEVNGIIPNPQWKIKNFTDGKWRIGDTYHTAIGQYGFQITPIQAVRAIGAVANNGKLVTPRLILNSNLEKNTTLDKKIEISRKNFRIVKEGMRQAVLEGTAKGLNIPQVKIAAKTGTAEVGLSKKLVNSWILGFFPYEKPRYAFVVVMEKGPRKNTVGGLYVMRQLIEWMSINTPEYLK